MTLKINAHDGAIKLSLDTKKSTAVCWRCVYHCLLVLRAYAHGLLQEPTNEEPWQLYQYDIFNLPQGAIESPHRRQN